LSENLVSSYRPHRVDKAPNVLSDEFDVCGAYSFFKEDFDADFGSAVLAVDPSVLRCSQLG